jgi:hypothetical protein
MESWCCEGQITVARWDMGYAGDLDPGTTEAWLATDRHDPWHPAATRSAPAAWPPRTAAQGPLKTLSKILRTPFLNA